MRKEDEIMIMIGYVANAQEKNFRDYAAANGLTGKQADILLYLLYSGEEAVNQKSLEHRFKVSKSSITTMLNTLERNGFIVRRRLDGRANAIACTEKAEKVKEGIAEAGVRRARLVFRNFSEEEKDSMDALLKKMLNNFQKEGLNYDQGIID